MHSAKVGQTKNGAHHFKLSLKEHLSVFVLNGYEELENFHDLDESELDYLGITDSAQRAKIMTAVELMQDNSCKLHKVFPRKKMYL